MGGAKVIVIPLPALLGNLQVAPSGACSSWSCRQSLCWWWWWWWKPVFYSCLSLARQLGSGLRWPTPEWPRGKGKWCPLILRFVTCRVQHKFWWKLDHSSTICTMLCFLQPLMTARVVSRADERRAGLYTVARHDIKRTTRIHHLDTGWYSSHMFVCIYPLLA